MRWSDWFTLYCAACRCNSILTRQELKIAHGEGRTYMEVARANDELAREYSRIESEDIYQLAA